MCLSFDPRNKSTKITAFIDTLYIPQRTLLVCLLVLWTRKLVMIFVYIREEVGYWVSTNVWVVTNIIERNAFRKLYTKLCKISLKPQKTCTGTEHVTLNKSNFCKKNGWGFCVSWLGPSRLESINTFGKKRLSTTCGHVSNNGVTSRSAVIDGSSPCG